MNPVLPHVLAAKATIEFSIFPLMILEAISDCGLGIFSEINCFFGPFAMAGLRLCLVMEFLGAVADFALGSGRKNRRNKMIVAIFKGLAVLFEWFSIERITTGSVGVVTLITIFMVFLSRLRILVPAITRHIRSPDKLDVPRSIEIAIHQVEEEEEPFEFLEDRALRTLGIRPILGHLVAERLNSRR